MAWIKRNLILVISGVVAVALLGLGGYYYYSANKKNKEVSESIESTKAEIKRLLDEQVTPTSENLKAAKEEGLKLNRFVADAKKLFPATPPPSEALTSPSFKSLLANSINELHRRAAAVPTRLETNATGPYYFTFESQRLALNLPPESLRPLYERLHEVQTMAQILFQSRVNRLVGMKRALVAGERPVAGGNAPGGSGDYLPVAARTNAETGMMMWPYEIEFDSFTPEIATVVEGLSAQPGIIIKTLRIRPADETTGQPGMRNPRQPQNPNQPVRPVRGNPAAPAAPAPAAAASPQLVTIINEKLVRVTLYIEVIKPDTSPSGGGPGPRGGPRGGPP
jgi:hypothetical protein